jgi:hypothetical protein
MVISTFPEVPMTVDEELLDEFRVLLTSMDALRELSDMEALAVVDEIARRFVDKEESVWWWQSLKCDSVRLPYGDTDGLALLGELVPAESKIRLVITDDEPRPWRVFEGEARKILTLLRELRFFEYFIASEDCRSVIFDTHHNALVAAGSILEKARCLAGVP